MSNKKEKEIFEISEEEQLVLSELNIDVKDLTESKELKISELEDKIYFPYSKKELLNKIIENKDNFTSIEDIINNNFIKSQSNYKHHPAVMRFKATYHLLHNKENKSRAESFKLASKLMIRRDLNPAIIESLKSSEELNLYLDCIKKVSFEHFNLFHINFEVHPLLSHKHE